MADFHRGEDGHPWIDFGFTRLFIYLISTARYRTHWTAIVKFLHPALRKLLWLRMKNKERLSG